ncbi:MAG TPA: tail fiber domain-containing protein [Anaerolineae bacterium]|nr:tail fiber domain-containing protein [Anaerolineae bacterium]
MQRQRLILIILIICAAIPIATHQLFSQTTAQDNDTRQSVTTVTQLRWQPSEGLAYKYATLSIMGNDAQIWQKTFLPDQALVLDLADEQISLADGSYQYQIQYVPELSAAVAERYAAEAAGDRNPNLPQILRESGQLPAEEMLTQTGTFLITNGEFILPTAITEHEDSHNHTADNNLAVIVHAEDVIINDSLAVGFDATNTENFGSDTIRLKENNIRIHFDDTSSTGSFPSNDWRIIANDSENGGGNLFAIEDSTAGRRPFTVEAGAPANILYLDSGGRIGIKTSTPVVDLHIVEGNSPSIRLDQDVSGGFDAQTWDIVGNEANFFIRDATNGSQLPFRIKPGALDDSIFIHANGNTSLGTDATSQGQLHIRGNQPSENLIYAADNTEAERLRLDSDGNLTIGGILTEASDKNLKENFIPSNPQAVLEALANMPVMYWNFISDENGALHLGPTAQDFYAAFGLGHSDTRIASLDANGVTMASIQALYQHYQAQEAAINDLQTENKALATAIADLEEENEDLTARVEALEALIQTLIDEQEQK